MKDANGNLLRIKTHDGHRFVETPDGTHGDLSVEQGRWSYTDGAGVRYDVKPTR